MTRRPGWIPPWVPLLPALLVAALLIAALGAPWLAPYDPAQQLDLMQLRNTPPSRAHWLGTDPFARDLLSRLLHGARTSLLVGALAALVGMGVGVVGGSATAFLPPPWERVLLGACDVLRTLPRLLWYLMVLLLLGPMTPLPLGIVVGLSAAPATIRLVHGEAAALRQRPFMEAARAAGTPLGRRLRIHLLPHLLPTVLATGVLLAADAMALEAGLSFVGVGVRPPHPSWGSMVHDGMAGLESAWWVAALPGAALVLTVGALARLADAHPARPGAS
jgi:peptide/nickel transport system permease protein